MKLLFLSALIAIAFAGALPEDLSGAIRVFADFKSTFNRQYPSAGEEAHRFGCFHANLKKINYPNSIDQATHGINKFTDLCEDEFKSMYHNLRIPKRNSTANFPVPKVQPLDAYDWRDHGAVNQVKDQAQCGSCWAFSTVAALEGSWVVSGKQKLASFSEEELVQCAKSAGDGCNGGDMIEAIQWVIKNGGIDSEADYPYTSGTGITGSCKTAKVSKHVGKFSTLLRAGTNEASFTSFLVAHGPLSIGVDASSGWQTYAGGVKTACSGRQLDHGVAIVGFGVEGTKAYWIVRNSWGQSWGENGYIRLHRGVDCDGLTSEVSTATASP
eukprot:NODE_4243_length_1200_cov_161.092851_g3743_i0.p1 GENE.NODE_4243_length_1200_cov_161.092851_g3743_i0~~NODE_4243_length_1200_cov_161.092851_g3743_i0.p1  ORF type:complete len:327 (-),score=71.48 NODE_4243_length_1200_cov_161.092851_g3743_i0:141-1121(-)